MLYQEKNSTANSAFHSFRLDESAPHQLPPSLLLSVQPYVWMTKIATYVEAVITVSQRCLSKVEKVGMKKEGKDDEGEEEEK